MVMRGNTSTRGRGRGGRGGRGRGGSRGRGYWASRGQHQNTRKLSIGGSDIHKYDANVSKQSVDTNVVNHLNDSQDQNEVKDKNMNRNINDKPNLIKNKEGKLSPTKDDHYVKLVGDESKGSSTGKKSPSKGPKENKAKSSKGKNGKRKKISSVNVDEINEPIGVNPAMKKKNKHNNLKAVVEVESDNVSNNVETTNKKTVLESPDGTFTMSPISELSITPRISEKGSSKKLEFPSVEYSYCISPSTGLYVFSVTNVKSGHMVTLLDRAKIVKAIPGVVLMNTWGKGDSLIVGVDSEKSQLPKMIGRVSEQLTEWIMSPLDIGNKDVFGFLSGWTEIPRVDGVGLYQLVVKFNSTGSKRDELLKRNQLLSLISNFNVAKVVHGEGESIIQVCHNLELAAYTDSIKTSFTVEKRHIWQLRPVENSSNRNFLATNEIYLWLKMNTSELSPAHEQFSVFHSLSTAGYHVCHLEHQLFGAPGNYLVALNVPSKEDNMEQALESLRRLCPQFTFLELDQEYLPDQYRPNYMVDNHGFYSVSGTFPSKISPELRNKFAEDMKNNGAVGFRVDESNINLFSLHFVNSRCLDSISRDSQFSMFSLVIQSNKVKKLVSKDILKILVPSILKYKEIIKANNVKEENNLVFKGDEKSAGTITIPDKSSTLDMEEKVVLTESIAKTHRSTKDNDKKGSKKVVKTQSAKLSADELFSLRWKNSSNIHNYLSHLVNLIQKFDNLTVTEDSGKFSVMFPSVAELDNVLCFVCSEETNSVEKLRKMLPIVRIEPSKFFKNKFGLLVEKYPAGKLVKYFESVGSMTVENRSNYAVAWFDSQLDLMRALVLGLRKQKLSGASSTTNGSKFTLSCNNFYFRRETDGDENVSVESEIIDEVMVGTQDKNDGNIVDTPAKIDGDIVDTDHKFILTEKEIFSFYWKSQRKDRSEEKAYSRYLTDFIKTATCLSLSTNEDGLDVRFSNQSDLDETVKRFCKEPSNTYDNLVNLSPSFTLIPSRGFYGLYSVKRVKPEHFAKFKDCKAGNNSVWFCSKLDLVQSLRDPLITKIYPALWIDCRNVYILQRKLQSSSSLSNTTVSLKVGVSTRSTVSRGKVVKSISQLDHAITTSNNIVTDAAIVSAGKVKDLPITEKNSDQVACTTGVSMLAAWKKDLVNKDNLREVTPRQAASVIGKAIEGNDVGEPGASLREIKMNRVEDFLKEKLGLSNIGKNLVNAPVSANNKIKKDINEKEDYFIKEVETAGQIICNLDSVVPEANAIELDNTEKAPFDDNKVISGRPSPKTPEELETERTLFEETALIFPSDMKRDHIAISPAEKVICDKDVDESDTVKETFSRVAEQKEVSYVEKLTYESEDIDISIMENAELKDGSVIKMKDKEGTTMTGEKTEITITAHDERSVALAKDHFIVKEVVTNDGSNNIDSTWKCDWFGFYTMLISVIDDDNVESILEIKEDFAWFDSEVCISLVDKSPTHSKMVEVKIKDVELASAALTGLKHKYPSLVKKQVEINQDKDTGLYTLQFSDIHKKRFKATMEHFKQYSGPGEDPKISRGDEKDQVFVSYLTKEEAKLALVNNFENVQFPNLQIITACLTEN